MLRWRQRVRFAAGSRAVHGGANRCPPAATAPPTPNPQPFAVTQVYKLFGSSFGFMLATNVAEPQAQHATMLLACARDLLQQLEQARGRCGRADHACGWHASRQAPCCACLKLSYASTAHGAHALPWLLCILQVRLPCGTPLRPVMALSSGAITSGLLGTVSLTYQVG